VIPVVRASFIFFGLLASTHAAGPTLPERSVSTSRQFLVYGADVRLRGVICDLAERTKRDALRLLDQRDEWITPIVVNVQYPQANFPERPRAALTLGQTGFGLKLQLDLTVAPDVAQPEVRRELLRAILLDLMYRRETNLSPGTGYIPPPDWLLEGIPAERSDFERERLVGILGAAATARKILSLAEFLGQRPDLLDGSGRSLHQAYSFALVEVLTQTSDGRRRLARFIADLSCASNDRMADLARHFPEMAGAGAAEKLWRVSLERLVASQSVPSLSSAETEEELDKALTLKGSGADSEREYRLDEFGKILRNASARSGLARCSRALDLLAGRANSIYRPVIHEYARIATLLGRGKTKGVAERMARVIAWRKSMAARVQEIADYLNWFEATKSPGPSGAFAGYMKAADTVARPEPRRRDAVSIYLDVLETQLHN
jgi:hypothetical protein